MKQGPQRYPGASTAYWHQSRYGGSAMESNVAVWHTTEGRTVPSYGGGASAPNFTMLPDIGSRKLKVYQHFDFDVSSRALVNLRGGVETNTLNAVQIELVGTCDERNASTWDGKQAGVDYLFWPDAPDWALAELGRFVRWAHDQHGVKMQSTVTWKPYKKGQVGGSYGANGVRLTGSQWLGYYGHLGHQHVPENAHGDPGDIDFARVLEHAKGGTTQEDEMQLNDKVEIGDWVKERWPDDKGLQDGSILVRTALGSGYAHARTASMLARAALSNTEKLMAAVQELAAQGAARDAVLARLAEGGGLDAAEMQQAAEAGATAALDRLANALASEEEG